MGDAPLRLRPGLPGQAPDIPPGIPIGTMVMFGAVTPPQGWLLCDGSAVSRVDYSALFAVIGTSFGSGDGSTTFNLPPAGRFLVAWDATRVIGALGGSATHSHTTHADHKHVLPFSVGASNIRSMGESHPYGSDGVTHSMTKSWANTDSSYDYAYSLTGAETSDLAHSSEYNEPPYVRVPMIIKY